MQSPPLAEHHLEEYLIEAALLGLFMIARPRKAAVMGAGTIGLLAAMALRLRGLDVTVFGRTAPPYLNSDLIEALSARYESTWNLCWATKSWWHGQRQS